MSVCIQVCQLSEEREALTLQLQIAKEQLMDVMQMVEGMEMAKGDSLNSMSIFSAPCVALLVLFICCQLC